MQSFFQDAISAMAGSYSTEIGIDDYYNLGYSKEQVKEIEKGLMFDLDVSAYARLDYEPHQMANMRELMLAGFDVSAFAIQY